MATLTSIRYVHWEEAHSAAMVFLFFVGFPFLAILIYPSKETLGLNEMEIQTHPHWCFHGRQSTLQTTCSISAAKCAKLSP
jgi:hypothetical protein